MKLQYRVLQGKKGNILGGDNIGHCDKKRAIYWEVIILVIVTKKDNILGGDNIGHCDKKGQYIGR